MAFRVGTYFQSSIFHIAFSYRLICVQFFRFQGMFLVEYSSWFVREVSTNQDVLLAEPRLVVAFFMCVKSRLLTKNSVSVTMVENTSQVDLKEPSSGGGAIFTNFTSLSLTPPNWRAESKCPSIIRLTGLSKCFCWSSGPFADCFGLYASWLQQKKLLPFITGNGQVKNLCICVNQIADC